MSDYARALDAAAMAQREVYELDVRQGNALAARNRALHTAWRARPGGTGWAELLAELNRVLPEGARLTYGGLRAAEREGRVA